MAAEEPTSVQDPATGGAEAAKAAKAMDKLDARGDDADEGAGKPVNKLDAEALQATIKQLSIGEKTASAVSGAGSAKKTAATKAAEEKKNVKVDAADVSLLVCRPSRPPSAGIHGAWQKLSMTSTD
jgi:hypothetical protein